MCGIVGYKGRSIAAPILLKGLKNLEYRGYDSAGIATLENDINVVKTKGRITNLSPLTKSLCGNCGIGHTRWATHGAATETNAHPHLSPSGKFAIVHNGIIENFDSLKHELAQKGYVFRSETDSEVIAVLMDDLFDGNELKTFSAVLNKLQGSYAIAMLTYDGKIYAAKKDSPLVIGLSRSETYVSSDLTAFSDKTDKFVIMEDEIAEISDTVSFFSDGKKIQPQIFEWKCKVDACDKSAYPHYMLKEIFEQPDALADTLNHSIKDKCEFLNQINNIHLIGCGSAYHAALTGKYVIESLTGTRVNADIASEFRYRNPIIRQSDLLIAISQSGETADTIGAVNMAKDKCKTACIVNVRKSTLARTARPFYTYAGPEIAVATTKGYTTQLINLYVIAYNMLGKPTGFLRSLEAIPQSVAQTLKLSNVLKYIGELIASKRNVFFIGRGADYAAAKESALKLKEISYIHADCYPAGELKHGTISLIEKGSVVIAIATDKELLNKTSGSILEVKARGAFTIGISSYELDCCDITIKLPAADFYSPLLATVACQLISYYAALHRGCDIDKPRNLAKSVTVE